jgi:hypothetical protein
VTPRIQALVVAVVVLAVLSPALRAGFVWDDARTVLNEPVMSDPGNVPGFFLRNIKSGLAESDGITEGFDLYRPMFLTALVAGWSLFGGPSAAGFHALCLLFHLAATLLVFALARRWLPGGREGSAAALAALAFGLHPVTAEGYLFVAALAEPMAATGLLATALLLDVIAVREADGDRRRTPILLLLGAAAMLFGLFSKESPLLLLPVLSVWLVAVRGLSPVRLVPSWAAAGIFLVMRAMAVGGLGAAGNDAAQRLESLERLPLLLLDGLRACLTGTPRGLRHLGYEWADVTLATSALCAAGVLVVAVGAWLVRRRAPLVTLFVFALGSALLPVAMVTTVPDWGGFGRYLYAPWAIGSMALIGGIAAGLRALEIGRPGITKKAALGFGVVYGALMLIGVREALHDWSGPAELAESGIRHAPDVGVHHAWLADVRREEGRLDEAEILYTAAIVRSPDYDPAWNHLAATQRAAGRCLQALDTVARKHARNGAGPRSTLIEVLCLIEVGRHDEAGSRLLWALTRVPRSDDFLRLQAELLRLHPDPGYRGRLEDALGRGEAGAATDAVWAMLLEK